MTLITYVVWSQRVCPMNNRVPFLFNIFTLMSLMVNNGVFSNQVSKLWPSLIWNGSRTPKGISRLALTTLTQWSILVPSFLKLELNKGKDIILCWIPIQPFGALITRHFSTFLQVLLRQGNVPYFSAPKPFKLCLAVTSKVAIGELCSTSPS